MGMNETLLTPREMAAFLKVSPTTLKRLRKAYNLPTLKLGHRTLRYDPGEVIQTLREATKV